MTVQLQERYDAAVRRIMDRSARSAGMIADHLAGDVAAEVGLRRTAELLARLGRPQDAMPIVHVAGTKGKGSTVAMIAAILTAAGHRTGRAISPHLHRYTERIAVDGVDIDDARFTAVTDQVLRIAERQERERPDLGQVNAYEALFAIALIAFREAGCVAAAVEVGIGGRLDASNVLDPAVSVITTLDLEHTAILGSTIADIAAEKAGIIKPGRPAVSAPQLPAAAAVLPQPPPATGSRLTVIDGRDVDAVPSTVGLAGPHQRVNSAVAAATVAELGRVRPELAVDAAAVRSGLVAAWLPGRFEVVSRAAVARVAGRDYGLPTVVLDGAHTPVAAAALRQTIDEWNEAGDPIVAICGLAGDKDAAAFLVALAPDRVVPVAADSPRALPAAELGRIARLTGLAAGSGPSTVAGAVHEVLTEPDMGGLILVTGSFAVIAEAHALLLDADNSGPAVGES